MPPPARGATRSRLRRVLLIGAAVAALAVTAVLGVIGISGIAATLPDVASLQRKVPARTALMRRRAVEARRAGRVPRVEQRWVPYAAISPLLRRAVLIAEDDAFFSHDGLDWNEIRVSAERNWRAGRVVRGGSTITQQLARNLYLSHERTVTRKLKEMMLAGRIERALSKRRIFELYLNLIEWGDGIYGIEAAARHHFGVPAGALDARQSALLAAVIINPRRFDPVHPVRRIERRAQMILSRMHRRGFLSEADYRAAAGLPPLPPPLLTPDSLGVGPDSVVITAPADSAAAAPPVPGPFPAPAPEPLGEPPADTLPH